jgi:hypothetical protein
MFLAEGLLSLFSAHSQVDVEKPQISRCEAGDGWELFAAYER